MNGKILATLLLCLMFAACNVQSHGTRRCGQTLMNWFGRVCGGSRRRGHSHSKIEYLKRKYPYSWRRFLANRSKRSTVGDFFNVIRFSDVMASDDTSSATKTAAANNVIRRLISAGNELRQLRDDDWSSILDEPRQVTDERRRVKRSSYVGLASACCHMSCSEHQVRRSFCSGSGIVRVG